MFKSWTRTSAQDISVCLILKSENTSGGQKALAMAEGSVDVPLGLQSSLWGSSQRWLEGAPLPCVPGMLSFPFSILGRSCFRTCSIHTMSCIFKANVGDSAVILDGDPPESIYCSKTREQTQFLFQLPQHGSNMSTRKPLSHGHVSDSWHPADCGCRSLHPLFCTAMSPLSGTPIS